MKKTIGTIIFLIIFISSTVDCILNPEEYPNLLSGSFTDGNTLSTGNTLPLVGYPWGFNHWSPQTKDSRNRDNSWWFQGNDFSLTWIRCTHQPSPWIGDWGHFLIMPQLDHVTDNPNFNWQPRAAILKPYLLETSFAPHNIRISLTPTNHAAYVKVEFPQGLLHSRKFFCFNHLNWKEHGSISTFQSKGQFLTGVSNEVHQDRMLVNNFNLYMYSESPQAIEVVEENNVKCYRYPEGESVVSIKIATSLISMNQAMYNLKKEIPEDKSFDDILLETKSVWNKLLRRVNVLDFGGNNARSKDLLTVFYTSLYRSLTFPRRLDEVDSDGRIIHFSPYDVHGQIHPGPLVTDNGFWDTFRTVYPLLLIAYPDYLGVILQGWLNAYKEGGWLPTWASPGYRNCMVGSFADVVISDAIVNSIPGFDLNTAVDAILKDSFEESPRYTGGAVGKTDLQTYNQLGFIPMDRGESVSRTLDYGYSDYSVAQALAFLGINSTAQIHIPQQDLISKSRQLFQRSIRAYQSLFDPGRLLMVPKSSNGQFKRNFNPIEWGNGFTEGNSYHHSFPPYSLSCLSQPDFIQEYNRQHPDSQFDCQQGLISLYNGKESLVNALLKIFQVPSDVNYGSYGFQIHEMTELIVLHLGQYGHNNQPVHHLIFLFTLLGEPSLTHRFSRYILERAYGPDFYSGDEDNGEMSAWFVLSALGLFPVTLSHSEYVVTAPLFRHVRIHRVPTNFKERFDVNFCYVKEGTYSNVVSLKSDRDGYQLVSCDIDYEEDTNFLDLFSLQTNHESYEVSELFILNQSLKEKIKLNKFIVPSNYLKSSNAIYFRLKNEEQSWDSIENGIKLLNKKMTKTLESQHYSLNYELIKEYLLDSNSEIENLKLSLENQQKELSRLQNELAQSSANLHPPIVLEKQEKIQDRVIAVQSTNFFSTNFIILGFILVALILLYLFFKTFPLGRIPFYVGGVFRYISLLFKSLYSKNISPLEKTDTYTV